MNGRSLGCLCLSAQTQKLFPACLWQLVSREVLNFRKADPCPVALTTFCLFLELRKYQKLVEPPPSAKPIAMDVDRKLEDGQKVTPVLLQKRTFEGQSGCQLKQCLGLLFPHF